MICYFSICFITNFFNTIESYAGLDDVPTITKTRKLKPQHGSKQIVDEVTVDPAKRRRRRNKRTSEKSSKRKSAVVRSPKEAKEGKEGKEGKEDQSSKISDSEQLSPAGDEEAPVALIETTAPIAIPELDNKEKNFERSRSSIDDDLHSKSYKVRNTCKHQ